MSTETPISRAELREWAEEWRGSRVQQAIEYRGNLAPGMATDLAKDAEWCDREAAMYAAVIAMIDERAEFERDPVGAAFSALVDDIDYCEACGERAQHYDADGVPLCEEHWNALEASDEE